MSRAHSFVPSSLLWPPALQLHTLPDVACEPFQARAKGPLYLNAPPLVLLFVRQQQQPNAKRHHVRRHRRQVREALRCVLHTILFHRALGPARPRDVHSELLEVPPPLSARALTTPFHVLV